LCQPPFPPHILTHKPFSAVLGSLHGPSIIYMLLAAVYSRVVNEFMVTPLACLFSEIQNISRMKGLSDTDSNPCLIGVKPASKCRRRIGFGVWFVRVEPNCVGTTGSYVLRISRYKSIQLTEEFSSFKRKLFSKDIVPVCSLQMGE